VRTLHVSLLMLSTLLGSAQLSAADDALATTRQIQIPAEDLQSALQTLSRLTELQIIYVSEDVAGINTTGLRGKLSAIEALRSLLSNTDLTYELLDARTVSIMPRPPVPGAGADAGAGVGAAAESAAASNAPLDQVTITAPTQPTDPRLEAMSAAVLRSRLASNSANGPWARWLVPVCPTTIGLQPQTNSLISDRIRQIAALVGAPVAPSTCTNTNVQILFTSNPQELLDTVAAHREQFLGVHFPSQLRTLKQFTQPIQAWYSVVTHTSRVSRSWGPGNPIPSQPQLLTGTRFQETLSSEIVNVLIVADRRQIVGRPVGAVADYVTALALYEHERARREGITATDTACLKALYGQP